MNIFEYLLNAHYFSRKCLLKIYIVRVNHRINRVALTCVKGHVVEDESDFHLQRSLPYSKSSSVSNFTAQHNCCA